MKRFINLMKNRMFWIGFQTCFLVVIICEFIEGKNSWEHAVIWGFISILSIGLDEMMIENEKE